MNSEYPNSNYGLSGFQLLLQASPIPEPSGICLAAFGLLSLGMTRRRRRT